MLVKDWLPYGEAHPLVTAPGEELGKGSWLGKTRRPGRCGPVVKLGREYEAKASQLQELLVKLHLQ